MAEEMFPALRSKASAIGFAAVIALFLGLPVIASWVGHPSREQAYAGLPDEAGQVGLHVREMFHDDQPVEVLFLGSSLVRAAIDVPLAEQSMSASIGRPVHIRILAMNWQGMDMEYFLLRDYLNSHHPSLIVWNSLVPGARNLEPHSEAFHWVRFDEYTDALDGLPLRYRLSLYGDMVLGAPREMLSHVRANKLSSDELSTPFPAGFLSGYYGADFIQENVDGVVAPPVSVTYETPPYPRIRRAGQLPDPYEIHFASKIFSLAAQQHIQVALLHIPIDSERGLDYMPERTTFESLSPRGTPFLGLTSNDLFGQMQDEQFRHYYRDQHFNRNGQLLYTKSIMPAIIKAYAAAGSYAHE